MIDENRTENNGPAPTDADDMFGREVHKCGHCNDRVAHKPIAHVDALDEPVGHLCLLCYSGWVQLGETDPDCVICAESAESAEFYTVRRLDDFGGNEVLATGNIGVCEGHINEFAARLPAGVF